MKSISSELISSQSSVNEVGDANVARRLIGAFGEPGGATACESLPGALGSDPPDSQLPRTLESKIMGTIRLRRGPDRMIPSRPEVEKTLTWMPRGYRDRHTCSGGLLAIR